LSVVRSDVRGERREERGERREERENGKRRGEERMGERERVIVRDNGGEREVYVHSYRCCTDERKG
jgi:hypothetical protein